MTTSEAQRLKVRIFFPLFMLFSSIHLLSQSTVIPSGGDYKSEKSSFSYSIGQIITSQELLKPSSLFGDPIVLSHGVQQVFIQTCDQSTKVEIIATPNPTSGPVTINLINWDENAIQLNVFDVLGKNVHSSTIYNDKTTLNFSYLSSGMYIFSLGYHCGSISSFKLLINK
jgi:hypothetical protein